MDLSLMILITHLGLLNGRNVEGHDLAGHTVIKVITVDNDVIDDLIILIVKANDQHFTAQRIGGSCMAGGARK